MLFFDLLYYFIYKFYSTHKEKGAESTSAGIIGGFQALNALTIVMLFHSMYRDKTSINKPVIIGLFVVFQVYLYQVYISRQQFR